MKKRRNILIIISLLVIAVVLGYIIINQHNKKIQIEKKIQFEKEQNRKLLLTIKSHYNDIVEIVNDTPLYIKEEDKIIKKGLIAKNEKIALAETNIDLNTKYFKLKDSDYYISYNDVKPTNDLLEKDIRYKRYLMFNENIVTKNNTKFYRGNTLVYIMDESLDLPIIIKDDNGFFVEYLGELLFVKKEDVIKSHKSNNTDLEESTGVPVTVYHFLYSKGEECDQNICHPESQVREHFDYLKKNDFFTINTTELRLYLEDKLRLPKKSILITIDDGWRAWKFCPILDEYQINATLFLISSWYETSRFPSKYLEIASHTHNLHKAGICPGGRGSAIRCLEKSKLMEDLTASRKKLNGTEAFCYPFYDYNDYAISALKEAGFKIAFAGGYYKAHKGVDLFKVPRIPLSKHTTLEQYINNIN